MGHSILVISVWRNIIYRKKRYLFSNWTRSYLIMMDLWRITLDSRSFFFFRTAEVRLKFCQKLDGWVCTQFSKGNFIKDKKKKQTLIILQPHKGIICDLSSYKNRLVYVLDAFKQILIFICCMNVLSFVSYSKWIIAH